MSAALAQTRILTGNEAAALAAKLCRVQVVAAYPITPQSQVTEALSRYVEEGALAAEYVTVESEHSAMSVCIGASTVGARVFTATSANGLAYMCEQLHWAAGARLPVVMCCVNRAMAAPWNVLNDQQDSMAQRDAGWIQLFARSNQEILDTVIQAYRIAESVYAPVMVCYDGYLLSHTVMPVEVPSQEAVDQFLPAYHPPVQLDPAAPCNINQVTLADPREDEQGVLQPGYLEIRHAFQQSLLGAERVIEEVDVAFASTFGRPWGGTCWAYELEGAEVALVAAGSLALEATVAVDALRSEGLRAGVLGLRAYRPFPAARIREALRDVGLVLVFDKSVSYGYEGPICTDLKAALYGLARAPIVHGHIAGLGGRDVKARELAEAARMSLAAQQGGRLDARSTWLRREV